jgi:hypothetical protein
MLLLAKTVAMETSPVIIWLRVVLSGTVNGEIQSDLYTVVCYLSGTSQPFFCHFSVAMVKTLVIVSRQHRA